ncbi:Dynamin-related protein 3A [Zea mays]|uniref:Dynamin-related protein 3A n=1 Tax=Zea mays TaxID=4577 RepID=A0A3L6EX96_MAIZE|nr:Dynamin-related protein 3A [Zea mays]
MEARYTTTVLRNNTDLMPFWSAIVLVGWNLRRCAEVVGLVLTVLSASRISWTGGTDACNFLLGNVIPLKFGYVGVVNHNQEAYHGLAHCWVVSQLAKELNMYFEDISFVPYRETVSL